MNKIPTAEDFLRDKGFTGLGIVAQKLDEVIIEFAKIHVKIALKEALDSIPCLGSSSDIPTYEEVENAVLNCYPLENIK